MTTAVCCLFLAPIGIASGGGHGNSVSTFGMPVGLDASGEGDLAGCPGRLPVFLLGLLLAAWLANKSTSQV